MTYVVVDIETTGLSKHHHKITEIAAAVVKDGKIKKEFQTLINPQVKIPSFITKLTGINNEMVKDAPTIREIMPCFLKILDKNIFVAHNATFDFGFLDYNSAYYYNKRIKNEKLCTKKLANRLVYDLPSKKLSVLCEHFGIENNQAHRAMSDVYATVGVLNNFLNILKDKGIHKVEDILQFEKTPRRNNKI
jgi:DNA polymerase III epsilon subunit family exonuclease